MTLRTIGGPAVAPFGSAGTKGYSIVLGWSGTDSQHTINIANSTIDGSEFGGQGTLPSTAATNPRSLLSTATSSSWHGPVPDPASTLNVPYL